MRLKEIIRQLQQMEQLLAQEPFEERRNPEVGNHDREYGTFIEFDTIELSSDLPDGKPGGNPVVSIE